MDYNGVQVFTGIVLDGTTCAITNTTSGMSVDIPLDLTNVGGAADAVITAELAY